MITKITSLFLAMLTGFILVRSKLLKSDDSTIVSKIVMYIVMPCAIISAFQISWSESIFHQFMFSLMVSAGVFAFQMVLVHLLMRPLKLTGLEKMASIYSNSGNLIIPLVGFCLGNQWVIFSLAYMFIQSLLMWTHGKALIQGKSKLSPKDLFLNVNFITTIVGFALFILNIQIAGPLQVFIDDMSVLLGPLSMLVSGMVIAQTTFVKVFKNKRMWLVCFIRLMLTPAIVVLMFKVLGLASLCSGGYELLIITLFAVSAPTAVLSVQMSQLYGNDSTYASSINVVSTVLCVATMPLWLLVYSL